jgi:hypothetical protein
MPDTFAEFVYSFCKNPELHKGELLKPQCTWLLNNSGQLYPDFIGKYENINKDFKQLCDILQIEYKKLPIRNNSEHDDYRKYYNQQLKELIGEFYKQDIKLLKYEW